MQFFLFLLATLVVQLASKYGSVSNLFNQASFRCEGKTLDLIQSLSVAKTTARVLMQLNHVLVLCTVYLLV